MTKILFATVVAVVVTLIPLWSEDKITAASATHLSASDYNSQGFDRYNRGDFDGAIVDFNQAIALDPKLAEAFNRRGNARRKKGDLDGAISDYSQAILADPGYANPHNNIGIVEVTKNDLEGAIGEFNRAIALNSKLAQAYLNRGIAKRNKGDLDGATADFNQAIALEPKIAPTTPAAFDPTQEELTFRSLVHNGDPSIDDFVSSFKVKGNTLAVTVTDKFNTWAYQDRLSFAHALYHLWAEFHDGKSESYVSPLSLTDTKGNSVGGTGPLGVWVSESSAVTLASNSKEAQVLEQIKKSQVRVSGRIVEVIESDSSVILQTEDGKLIWVSGVTTKKVDGDAVTVMAVPNGPTSYRSLLGGEVTVQSYYVLPKD